MKKNILALLLIVVLTSCGYIGEDPVDNKTYVSPSVTACKADPGAMSDFMTRVLTKEIDCLETNLDKYAEAVQRENRDYIDHHDLERFVRKFFKEEHIEKTLDSMDLFYQLIRILLQDEDRRLSIKNIPEIIDVLRVANREFVTIYDVFKNIDERKEKGELWSERRRLRSSVNRFSESLLTLIENSDGHKKALKGKEFANIDFRSLLVSINRKLGDESKVEDAIWELALIGKSILLGGERETISTIEVLKLLRKLPDLSEILIDMLYVDDTQIEGYPDNTIAKNGMWSLYLNRLRTLKEMITWDNYDKVIITTDDIITIAESLVDFGDLDLNNFRESLEEAKFIMLQGDPTTTTVADLRTLFSEAEDLVGTLYFNSVTYDHYQEIMNQNRKITTLPGIETLSLPEFGEIFNNRIRTNTARKEFEDLAQMIRLYRTEDNTQYYQKDIIRTKYGLNETAMVRFMVRKLLRRFGTVKQSAIGGMNNYLKKQLETQRFGELIERGAYSVNPDELFQALLAFKPMLQELDLWTLHPETYAKNTLTMGDLFMMGSNADDTMNVTEATQYVQLILTTLGMSSNFLDNFENNSSCKNVSNDPDDPAYEIDCYRKHVFDFIVEEGVACEDQPFSNLCRYHRSADFEEKDKFLENMEYFAREPGYVDDGVPMYNRDLILVLGSVLSIESMMIRFDTNKNNQLDNDEVDESFKLYKNIIILKANMKGLVAKLAKNAYKYMISQMELPGAVSLVWYSAFGGKKKNNVIATRKNVGAIFYYLANLGKDDKKEEEDDHREEYEINNSVYQYMSNPNSILPVYYYPIP